MKKQVQLLITLTLSIVINLFSTTNTIAILPGQIQGQLFPSLAPMLQKVLPSVVTVHVEAINEDNVERNSVPFKNFLTGLHKHDVNESPEQIGSGIIINAVKGYILTNSHLVRKASKITVRLSNGKEYGAILIGSDEQTDLSLIQVPKAKNFIQIQIANSDYLKVGDFAVAIGNPFGLNQSVSSGIISALGRNGLNLVGLEDFIQTDAAINNGNSGGPLVNLNGELIGINTAILASRGGNIGIGFAIPSNMAMNIVRQLTQFGEIKHSKLGVKGTEMNSEIAKIFKIKVRRGAFISEVVPKSPAEEAGIKSGDIITGFNNQPISSFAELRVKITTSVPYKDIKINLLRENKPVILIIKLQPQKNIINFNLLPTILQGVRLTDGKTKTGIKGIEVDFVKQGTPAEHNGLRKNDIIISINRNRVKSISDIHWILKKQPSLLILNVIRDNQNIYIFLR